MIEEFESTIYTVTKPRDEDGAFCIFDPTEQFDEGDAGNAGVAKALNAAFLITLAGRRHPASERAKRFLARMVDSPEWKQVATFYLNGIDSIRREIDIVCRNDSDFVDRLETLSQWVSKRENLNDTEETTEKIWSVFFPEAAGMRGRRQEQIEALRRKRTVTITRLNANPVTDPAREILFTSNVLMTVPPPSKSTDDTPLSGSLREKLARTTDEPQLYWYDHPIPVGVEPQKNEVLYGLRGLEAAVEFERIRGNMEADSKLTCVLSASVTHQGLQEVAKAYLEEEFTRAGRFKNLQIYVFTEAETERIMDEILAPAAERYLGRDDARGLLGMFGVDGEYGRHYSFLKAIAAFWQVFVEPEIKATFKIDLDQVFPQEGLVTHTGASAFEHLRTPLWGADGVDCEEHPVELGMMAGALVNKRDISKSLFTPDVPFPNQPLSPDEYIFFSTLPQALSTEAEMMTRYGTDDLDGNKTCIQRLHVTGGTNGILVDSLRRYRPFSPSFIGRAEDQAYILSVFSNPGAKLAYVHKDGLIMSHDKEAFAEQAIESAYVGKLLGDYVRTLYFSSYARVLADHVTKLKDLVDPYTGCFISRIPTTVVYLRFSLKAASFFVMGGGEQGVEFVTEGSRRIANALDFVRGEKSAMKQRYEEERLGWDLYYDVLSAVEKALDKKDSFALELCRKAEKIIDESLVSPDSPQ
ncbi:MAG: hypothetical protein ABID54_05675 [Pseudomonadota bacterium]